MYGTGAGLVLNNIYTGEVTSPPADFFASFEGYFYVLLCPGAKLVGSGRAYPTGGC